MIYAQRGNRVVKINEESIDRYANQGYKILNEKGEVVKDTMPTDVPTLQRAYKEHIKEIAELKAEIDTLKAEIANAKSAPKTVKSEVEDTVEEIKTEPKPKTKTTKKSE